MSKTKLVASEFMPLVSLKTYISGFAWCVLLTLLMYFVAVTDTISDVAAIAVITLFALMQFTLQMVWFLHLGHEHKPRVKTAVFWLMLTIVFIVVGGSVWIMNNLNYRMIHNPGEMRDYIERTNGF